MKFLTEIRMSNSGSSLFCKSLNTELAAFTDDNLMEKFGSKDGKKGLLNEFDSAPNDPNRDSNGMLKQSFLKEYVEKLQSSDVQIIPKPPDESSESTVPQYMQEDEYLLQVIKEEYCYYESRYFYALDRLITSLKDGFLQNDANKRKMVEDTLKNTRLLNLRLNDLLQIANYVTKFRLIQSQNYNDTINNLNTTMEQRSAKIRAQAEILNNENATALLRKEMVKYTEEKNRANSNLLSLYSFLNIFALGMLVYIYRST